MLTTISFELRLPFRMQSFGLFDYLPHHFLYLLFGLQLQWVHTLIFTDCLDMLLLDLVVILQFSILLKIVRKIFIVCRQSSTCRCLFLLTESHNHLVIVCILVGAK